MKKILTSLIILTACGTNTYYLPGNNGAAGATGSSGLIGNTGEQGIQGSTGIIGPTGAIGITGSEGVTGNSGANISYIKFCNNYIGSYPGSFPEYGICIDNNLFAVYWDGRNSWLAMVYPGYYKSTSTTAPCNFTVLPNCIVQ